MKSSKPRKSLPNNQALELISPQSLVAIDYKKYGIYLVGLDLDEEQKKVLINTVYRVCELELNKKYEPKTISTSN